MRDLNVECNNCVALVRVTVGDDDIEAECPQCWQPIDISEETESPGEHSSQAAPGSDGRSPRQGRPTPANGADSDEDSVPNFEEPNAGGQQNTLLRIVGAPVVVFVLLPLALCAIAVYAGIKHIDETRSFTSGNTTEPPTARPTTSIRPAAPAPQAPGSGVHTPRYQLVVLNPQGSASTVASATADVAGPYPFEYRWEEATSHVYEISLDTGPTKSYSGRCTFTLPSPPQTIPRHRSVRGTGFVVSDARYIVTSAHIVANAKSISVWSSDERGVRRKVRHSAEVGVIDHKRDLAILRIDGEYGSLPVSFARSLSSDPSQEIRAIGYSGAVAATSMNIMPCEVMKSTHSEHAPRIQIGDAFDAGCTGSPLVSRSGHVLGMLHAGTPTGEVIPASEITSWLASLDVDVTATQAAKSTNRSVASTVREGIVQIEATSQIALESTFSYTSTFAPRLADSDVANAAPVPPFAPATSTGVVSADERGHSNWNDTDYINVADCLPCEMGRPGALFIEELRPDGEWSWTTEVKRKVILPDTDWETIVYGTLAARGPDTPTPDDATRPFFRPKPFLRSELLDAVEKSEYTLSRQSDGRLRLNKVCELRSTDEGPSLVRKYSGHCILDQDWGLLVSVNYTGSLIRLTDNDSQTIPFTLVANVLDPATIVAEEVAAAQRAQEEERRMRESIEKERLERERSVPNPELVEEILSMIDEDETGDSHSQHFSRLATIALVPDKRESVVLAVTRHIQDTDRSRRDPCVDALCHWATRAESQLLLEVTGAAQETGLSTKKNMLAAMGRLKNEQFYPLITAAFAIPELHDDARAAFVEIGPEMESFVLKSIVRSSDGAGTVALIQILEELGTKSSLPLLRTIMASGAAELRTSADEAMKAIRSRD